jgi:hypothetical protein
MEDKLVDGVAIKEVRIKSFGEILFGIDLQTEDDTEVYRVKKAFAELAEKLKDAYNQERSPVRSLLFDHAIGELVNAQMSVVKVLTFKEEQ